jgi:hypothetical protein
MSESSCHGGKDSAGRKGTGAIRAKPPSGRSGKSHLFCSVENVLLCVGRPFHSAGADTEKIGISPPLRHGVNHT